MAAAENKMYCTIEDIKKQINENVLLRVAGDADGLQVEVVEFGILQAAGEIDAYCSRYGTPLTTVPDVLVKYCVDMALFHIFSRQGFALGEESEDYVIYLRYKMAVSFLEKVATGKIELPIQKQNTANQSTTGSVNVQIGSSPRIFSRETMKGF